MHSNAERNSVGFFFSLFLNIYIYIIPAELKDDLILAPAAKNLRQAAVLVGEFLKKTFLRVCFFLFPWWLKIIFTLKG